MKTWKPPTELDITAKNNFFFRKKKKLPMIEKNKGESDGVKPGSPAKKPVMNEEVAEARYRVTRQRPTSLPKILISGGYTISQNKVLEMREYFSKLSGGTEAITLECSILLTKPSPKP